MPRDRDAYVPFGPPPRTREAWVVSLADKAASLTDLTISFTGMLTGHTWRRRRVLCASDHFYPHRRHRLRRARRWHPAQPNTR